MLFKHPENSSAEKKEAEATTQAPPVLQPTKVVIPPKDVSPEALRELLEKNLKWSQIIYEQNRKINSKLFWTAFANWLRLLILIGTFAAAAWFLPPLIRDLLDQYQSLFSSLGLTGQNTNSVNDVLKILPLSPEQENIVKSIIKTQQ